MGDVIKSIGLPVGDVYSSVSCRAKQTAVTSFGKAPIISRLLLHRGPFREAPDHLERLKNFYLGLSPGSPKNTLISAHNNVVSKEMFLNEGALGYLSLEEGGFYVISVTEDGLVLEHTFFTFWDFAHHHFPRE
jgi:hypothetical protein